MHPSTQPYAPVLFGIAQTYATAKANFYMAKTAFNMATDMQCSTDIVYEFAKLLGETSIALNRAEAEFYKSFGMTVPEYE